MPSDDGVGCLMTGESAESQVLSGAVVDTPITTDYELDALANVIAEAAREDRWSDPRSLAADENAGDDWVRFGDPASWFQGRTIIQMGWAYTYDNENGIVSQEHVAPDLLLRYGVSPRLQLQFGWAGLVHTKVEDTLLELSDEFDDLDGPNVGAMLLLWRQDGIRPRLLIGASLPIDTEGDPFALEALQPATQVTYSWRPRESWRLSGTTGALWISDEDGRSLDFNQSFTMERSFDAGFGAYFGWNGLFAAGNRSDQHVLEIGTWFDLSPSKQLDFRFGRGMNESAPDVFTAVGLSFGY